MLHNLIGTHGKFRYLKDHSMNSQQYITICSSHKSLVTTANNKWALKTNKCIHGCVKHCWQMCSNFMLFCPWLQLTKIYFLIWHNNWYIYSLNCNIINNISSTENVYLFYAVIFEIYFLNKKCRWVTQDAMFIVILRFLNTQFNNCLMWLTVDLWILSICL